MSWRFRDHRCFQRDALGVVAAGGALGALAWAWPSSAEVWWMATGLGVVISGLAQRAARARGAPWVSPRRAVWWAGAAALAGAALAAATWRALELDLASMTISAAVVVGLMGGTTATLALVATHLERINQAPLGAALARARASLTGDERALAERAATAHRRIAEGIGAPPDAEGHRLARLAEQVTRQVLELATRCCDLRGELATTDLPAVRARAIHLADAADHSTDEAARADLLRAARAVVQLNERAQALAAAAARARARLELQVALLEGTALAIAARQANLVADGAQAALGPLADKLHEAGTDLHTQALALAETHLVS